MLNTDPIRYWYTRASTAGAGVVAIGQAEDEFDEWLLGVKRKAWDEGFDFGHYLPSEDKQCDCRENPYDNGEE